MLILEKLHLQENDQRENLYKQENLRKENIMRTLRNCVRSSRQVVAELFGLLVSSGLLSCKTNTSIIAAAVRTICQFYSFSG